MALAAPLTTGAPSRSPAGPAQHPASGGWNGRQVMDACRYEADPHGFTTWHDKAAARVEVDPGDDPLALGEDSERAEMLTLQDATGTAVPEGSGIGPTSRGSSFAAVEAASFGTNVGPPP